MEENRNIGYKTKWYYFHLTAALISKWGQTHIEVNSEKLIFPKQFWVYFLIVVHYVQKIVISRNQIQFQILFGSIVINLSNSHLRVGMSKPLSGLCPMQWWCQLIRLILFWPRISSCWEAPLILEGAIKECRGFFGNFFFFFKKQYLKT